MPQYTITRCTVADGPDVARNNASAFWRDPNWRMMFRTTTLEHLIEQVAKRAPRNLLRDRERLRHLKAVDDAGTGRLVGYARFLLPDSSQGCATTTAVGGGTGTGPVWPEAQTPDVTPGERAEIERVAETADWSPDESSSVLDEPLSRRKREILARKDYLVIDYLAVHPEYQGRGIATALVKAGIAKAEELGLDVFVLAFKGGFKTYENTGFKVLDEFVQDATPYGGDADYRVRLLEYSHGRD